MMKTYFMMIRSFYDGKVVIKTTWWLADCDFPEVHWGRMRVFNDGTADVNFDGSGHSYGFGDEQSARYFLTEDEYTQFDLITEQEAQEYGIGFSALHPPQWNEQIQHLIHYYETY